jgi:hypothetical protein
MGARGDPRKEAKVIAVIRTDSGNFNVIGTADDMFVIQGNLTEEQLLELREKIDEALEDKDGE